MKGVFIWLSILLKIRVTIQPKNTTQTIEIQKGAQFYDLLQKMELKPDNIIILNKNTPVPVDDIIDSISELIIIQVASGG